MAEGARVADGSVAAAAKALRHCLETVAGPPPPLAIRERAVAVETWLHDIRLACARPPPEAEKVAEWLLDNDYQVYRALRLIRQDLPDGYYGRLPTVRTPSGRELARVYAIAHSFLVAAHLQVSLVPAIRFVRAFQTGDPLTIGELWAFPTFLRIACIETMVEGMAEIFPDVSAPLRITAGLAGSPQFEASERVARAVANLGLISAIPWEDFFDRTSRVERMLRSDPAKAYARCDFETRDHVRRAVEKIAFQSSAGETAVAAAALRLSQSAIPQGADHHVGYWLIGPGRPRLEAELGAVMSRGERLRRATTTRPGLFYAAALAWCSAAALLLPIVYLAAIGATPSQWVAALLVTLIPASILAVTAVNWAITRWLPPRFLPKLDFAAGLGPEASTIVAVPVMIGEIDDVPRLSEQIETHWLANADPRLHIVLLADFPDAASPVVDDDAVSEHVLRAEIDRLNRKHGRKRAGPFHLLLRPRAFNPAEECWMAWERKRGKIEQLNRLLVAGEGGAFTCPSGDVASLAGIRFVVTVDADTMLPPGSVAKLAGTLAHPLNKARFDEATDRVVEGYSIIQPRIEISPQCGGRSLFARLFTGETAIDIYSRAVSDIYQDLFGSGIFTGKGIYDAHVFDRALHGRVPENRILSHDLFEGAHGRVGLATDIVLYEGFPASFLEYASRLQRWIRGDWQLLPWLARRVPIADGTMRSNPLPAIERWKIVDNLRRSMVAPSILLMAVAGWLTLPGQPWVWTTLALFAPAGQLFADLVSGLARGRRRGVVRGIVAHLQDQAGRWLLAVVFLLHEARLSVYAIAVTMWRLRTGRHLLQWTTAAQVAARLDRQSPRVAAWRTMGAESVAAMLVAGAVAILRPSALPAAVPLILLWIGAPEIAVWTSLPRKDDSETLLDPDVAYLRELARRTWYFFEMFAGPQDNWLPPDNYQGAPYEEIAHRTSPTNIGMLLLSTAAAWDLGFIGRIELAARTRSVLASLGRMQRYRGHWLNWYDTRTLDPLEPRYVSTVDSGNLAASLIAFAAALEEAADATGPEIRRGAGMQDVLRLLRASLDTAGADIGVTDQLDAVHDALDALAADPPFDADAINRFVTVSLPSLEHSIDVHLEHLGTAGSARFRDIKTWLERLVHQAQSLRRDLGEGGAAATDLVALAGKVRALAYEMDFKPLYNKERHLLFLGINISSGTIDPHHYDLLASEARLASFWAIVKGDVPLEHWFHLGRPVTRLGRDLTLVSWNGSMFEYLMPRLFLRGETGTLLSESERTAVTIQRKYGERNAAPWGISESAFASRDPEHRYRYQAFGAPRLGLRRGLTRDLVVAPYASALALAVAPQAAVRNLKELDRLCDRPRYGLVEALDFTPSRRSSGHAFAIVDAFMAHHQGMIVSAIDNVLFDDIFVRRLEADPRVGLAALVLSERVPRELPSELERLEELERPPSSKPAARLPPPYTPPADGDFPLIKLLGNGRMATSISESGGARLMWKRQALTRFVADPTRDSDGVWIYLADDETGDVWAATRQPTRSRGEEYRATFHAHMAEFQQLNGGIRSKLEVAVAADDDLEIRRLSLTNEGDRHRRIRVTSYGEVVLAPALEDERHPAFSKLFVGSEASAALGGQLFTRRPQSPRTMPPVLLHLLLAAEGTPVDLRWEGSRLAFVGRGRDLADPLGARGDLGGSAGFTLDPVMALQTLVDLDPYERCELCFLTIAAPSRETAIEIAHRHATLASIEWILSDAADAAAQRFEAAHIDPDQLLAVETLASLMTFPQKALRAERDRILANRLGQSDLWGVALSGDLPILLLRARTGSSELLPILVAAQRYWNRLGLEVDLVVVQTGASSYIEPVRDRISATLREADALDVLGRSGGVHLLFADQMNPAQLRLLETAAWAVLDEDAGGILDQLASRHHTLAELPHFVPSLSPVASADQIERPTGLVHDNGFGGFSADGREYVIHLAAGETTPAPWCNILANDDFGTLVSESGGGFSWAVNSGEHRLSPSNNDPVVDRPTEIVYLRDEETGVVWTVTPGPAGGDCASEIRHAAGRSTWRKRSQGFAQDLTVFVPHDASVRIAVLKIRNLEQRYRRMTATFYAEWMLGALPSIARRHVVATIDPDSGILFARSTWNPDFAGRVAFLTANRTPHSVTTDRTEFIGREGDLGQPAGLKRWALSGHEAIGGDCCAAFQVHVDLDPGGEDEIMFILGEANGEDDARALARHWRSARAVKAAGNALVSYWDSVLGAIEVRSPDPEFDLMVNRWLRYQSLSSRVMARTGFYQSSGAIGFRDQLQDVLALLQVQPERARAHILNCAAHQFVEGDVLHWWHPPSGRGVRTRCSDDAAWLAYATGVYVRQTGDTTILEEEAAFLEAPPLDPNEEDRYALFRSTARTWPLIDHVERALDRVMTKGGHGLPLIGGGDWNDGMNRLGNEGRGESVWLAWFGSVTADLVADLNRRLGREDAASDWTKKSRQLRERAEAAGWDGAWYRRAYDDQGAAVGSAHNAECRIDSICQSWAVFAGADPARLRRALQSVDEELVDSQGHLASLLWPPFDHGLQDPGYIKAYPPGIRENGGQYSHAAAWLGLAFTVVGDPDRAKELFDCLNPLRHSATREQAAQYRVEPYVIAGDIYASPAQRGQGGWTWYTGAAAWAWRLAAEGILGLRLEDGKIFVQPCIPRDWGGYDVVLKGREGSIAIRVDDPGRVGHGAATLFEKGKPIENGIAFPADGTTRRISCRITAGN